MKNHCMYEVQCFPPYSIRTVITAGLHNLMTTDIHHTDWLMHGECYCIPPWKFIINRKKNIIYFCYLNISKLLLFFFCCFNFFLHPNPLSLLFLLSLLSVSLSRCITYVAYCMLFMYRTIKMFGMFFFFHVWSEALNELYLCACAVNEISYFLPHKSSCRSSLIILIHLTLGRASRQFAVVKDENIDFTRSGVIICPVRWQRTSDQQTRGLQHRRRTSASAVGRSLGGSLWRLFRCNRC